MAGLHPRNQNFREHDHGKFYDHVAKRPRYQGFEENAWDAANPRGGGGGFCFGRGGGRSEHVQHCYGRGEPGHVNRYCPKFRSFPPSNGRNFTSESMSLKNKLAELKQANDAEMNKLKLKSKQWMKAAKALSFVLNGSVGISSKTPELEVLVLYYSNRAAKRMSLGKMRKAVDDCKMAARLDPGCFKICVTAGTCHLALGELDDALYNYKKCLDSLDRRLTIEASNGIQNAEKVVCHMNKSAELLRQKTSESATNALGIINTALSRSCYSEKLLEMKGEALFLLKRYDEAVQVCEQTLPFAENNHISDEEQKQPFILWRWRLMFRSYFCLARFDMAHVILGKYEQMAPAETRTEGPSSFSAATISELFRFKNAGNEAYKAGRHQEAVHHYSNALELGIISRPFAAICLCNRAAPRQALGEVVDAIADCNLAIALDGNYIKAISRRANLYEKIRDYEHASLDLLRLINLLEEQSEDEYVEDLIGARERLSSMSKYLKLGTKLDCHLILGLKGSESGSDIRKAYHKAALRHHPDKAGKLLLAKCEISAEDGDIWEEISKTIQKDADKLFKIIGEAYAVLS